VDSNRINGIIHKCYRNSIIATISNTIVSISFKISIFQNRRFLSLILLTNFSKNIYIKSGYPNERIYTKGNFSTPASLAIEAFPRNGPITFVGRLSVEKGAQLLAEIASLTNHPIDVIGDGPEFEWLKRQAIQNLNLRGPITRNEALAAISRAKALIIPSLWYEGFPMVLVEAFSAGTPVIAPNIGSFRELIDDGETGILAEPKNASSWVNAIQRLEDTNTSRNISKNCLSDYNNQLSTARGVRQLINIYWACIHSVDNGGR
jgi:glycosyltransferase involved in cell wall biosynthesis